MNNRYNITRLIQNYLIGALPLVILCGIVGTLYPSLNTPSLHSFWPRMIWNILGINLMVWFAMVVLFMASLVLIPQLREKTLSRLANIRENDEREAYITGQAARKAYLTTLSLGLFLLFFSLFSLQIIWNSEAKQAGKPSGEVSISFGFHLFSKNEYRQSSGEYAIINTEDIQLSNASILIILLTSHLVTFSRTARRMARIEETTL